MSSLVKYEELDNSIVRLTLNRQEAANSLSNELINGLSDVLDKISTTNVRCIILTGSGEKAFCAGADLKERIKMNDVEVPKAVAKIRSLTSKIALMPMPVIAALNGVAFGGGLEIALACDIRLANENIMLGLTETGLGIIPGAGGTQRLPRLVGEGQAKNMILRAKRMTAKEAFRIGLLQEIYPLQELNKMAYMIACEIANNSPLAVGQAKLAISNGMQVPLKDGLEIEKECYQTTIPTKDRIEGLRAFQEKRPPVYVGE